MFSYYITRFLISIGVAGTGITASILGIPKSKNNDLKIKNRIVISGDEYDTKIKQECGKERNYSNFKRIACISNLGKKYYIQTED